MKKPTEQRVVLSDISWQQFKALLEELGTERVARLTYNRSKLELMTPSPDHDRCHRLIESLLLVLADELHLSLHTRSPILLTAADRQLAAELDAAYYLEQLPLLGDRPTSDVTQTPPPDLAIEIAMTKSSFDKLAIYADLGIAEVWRYVTRAGDDLLKGDLLIYQLQDDQYVQRQTSALFPVLPAQQVLQFIEQSDTIGLVQALKLLRHWIQERI